MSSSYITSPPLVTFMAVAGQLYSFYSLSRRSGDIKQNKRKESLSVSLSGSVASYCLLKDTVGNSVQESGRGPIYGTIPVLSWRV
jgi:hypothetical protein